MNIQMGIIHVLTKCMIDAYDINNMMETPRLSIHAGAVYSLFV